MSKDAPTLADAVMRAYLHKDHRRIDPNNWLATHIAQARKFVLDESMSAFTSDLAHASMRTCETQAKAHMLLNSMRSLARLPFKTTWIEFDMLAKVRRTHDAYDAQTSTDPAQTPDRSGWLLLQHPTLETAFMALPCCSHTWDRHGVKQAEPHPSPFAYAWRSDAGPPPWPKDPFFNRRTPIDGIGFGEVIAMPEGVLTAIPTYTTESFAIVANPFIPRALAEEYANSDGYHPLGEMSGDLRQLWALLATINDLPTSMREVRQDRGYIARGSYRKFCDHTVVTMTVPAKRYATIAKRAIAIARRRAHSVRGHWRVNRFHPGERIWIREHTRGDASLGFVLHDFAVTHPIG